MRCMSSGAPPEGADVIRDKLADWERFIHADDELDPSVHGLAHYQFEAIHPFHDGNGRTGTRHQHLDADRGWPPSRPDPLSVARDHRAKERLLPIATGVTADDAWIDWILRA